MTLLQEVTLMENDLLLYWISLMEKAFFLHKLFFAYEDRENICRHTIKTFVWLSLAVALMYSRVITTKDLWENITHIMSNSVSKTQKIYNLVAEKLDSKHIPLSYAM